MSTHTLADYFQTHQLTALQGLQALASRQPLEVQRAFAKHLKAAKAALRFVGKQYPSEVVPHEPILDPAKLRDFAKVVQGSRKAAGFTQLQLAGVAGLSLNTIKHIETAQHTPTQATLLRLLSVRELGLDANTLPWELTTQSDLGTAPNCWIAPGYDSIKMFTDLLDLLEGRGGTVEQTYSYLDHKSALNYYALTNQSSYVTEFRSYMPLPTIGDRILELTGRAGLELIGLGAGDGKQEVLLAQHLLNRTEQLQRGRPTDLRLYLIDISQPLLNAAYKHAADTIGHRRGVYLCAVQGNFHHLPRYTQLHYAPQRSHRRRVILMLGGTVCNLEDDHRFFHHSVVGFAPGDLLLVQLQLGVASGNSPDEIRAKDPALQTGLPSGYAEWLAGPIWRYCDRVTSVKFDLELDTRCAVPGSYSLDAVATVSSQGRRDKRFMMMRFKRYDAQQFAAWLRPLGWELVAEAPFSGATSPTRHTLLLLQKLPDAP